MAANTCTSEYNTVAGTDPTFTITHKTANVKKGVWVYAEWTIGSTTSIALTFQELNPSLHATNLYNVLHVASDGSHAALTATLATASKNVRVWVPMSQGASSLVVTGVFTSANQGGAVVIKFQDA